MDKFMVKKKNFKKIKINYKVFNGIVLDIYNIL